MTMPYEQATDLPRDPACPASQLRVWGCAVRVSCGLAPTGARIMYRLSRASHGQPVDAQRRLADADRYVLPFLAAGAHTLVELQVVADHAHARQHVGSVADERRPFERCSEAAILDRIGLARGEDEFPGSDVHLSAAEIHRID